MKKSILKLDGVTELKKEDQLKINGGDCMDTLASCRGAFETRNDINTCMHVFLCGHIQIGPQIIISGDL